MPAVLYEQDGRVATITLNRPDVLNALDPGLARELFAALQTAGTDDGVRCVVVRGAGGHFLAGGDIEFFRTQVEQTAATGADDIASIFEHVHGAIRVVRRMPKPVIASVSGAAAGFGVSLMAACDLAVSADNTVFTLAYCHIGASPDGGSTYFLPRIVGLKRTMELVLLGDRFDANTALNMGLVNRVVAADQLEAETIALAERLASGPSTAYSKAKILVNASLHNDLDTQLDFEQMHFLECTASDDFVEGVRAFCEKRRPKFS
ncbi:MAG: enoyl-CoA hydratase [Gammaproteobacteria bacterium]|nr:enoyl-CoA hydratase [Gammaproteobacteria bacterium]MDH3466238.1 enoyl-CoA hydratase [Gammaproteobacteria bacterium]